MGIGKGGITGDGFLVALESFLMLSLLHEGSCQGIERPWITGLHFQGAAYELGGSLLVILLGILVGQDNEAPGVVRCEAQGLDEVVLGLVIVSRLDADHGQIAAGIRMGRIQFQNAPIDVLRLLVFTLSRPLGSLFGKAGSLSFAGGLGVRDRNRHSLPFDREIRPLREKGEYLPEFICNTPPATSDTSAAIARSSRSLRVVWKIIKQREGIRSIGLRREGMN